MNAIHHADVLVVGHSLEGALTAALLARRGTNVLWLGQPPAPYEKKDSSTLRTAPSLTTSLTNQPALRTVLGELAMEIDLSRQFEPVPLQLLGDRRRFTFPHDVSVASGAKSAFSRLKERLDSALEPSRQPTSFSAWGLRALAKNETAFESPNANVSRDSPDVAALMSGLTLAVGKGLNGDRALVPLVLEPHRFDGGVPRLVELLFRRFKELGGRVLPQALTAPAREFRAEFRGIRIVLSNGDQVSAPALVMALSHQERERLLPTVSGFFSRGLSRGLTALPKPTPLVRTTWMVKDSGLPAPLGPVAVVAGSTPMLVERHALSSGLSELSVHRLASGTDRKDASDCLDALEPVLPFFQRHVLHERTFTVPHHGATEPLPVRLGRVHLAVPGVAGLCGWDGAALIASAIATKLSTTRPRRDVLPASVTRPPPTRNAAGASQGSSRR